MLLERDSRTLWEMCVLYIHMPPPRLLPRGATWSIPGSSGGGHKVI
ncbi:hypothetical protein ACP70R_009056 [Stipagrostis hirtigluma subsp. patula]